MLRTTAYCKEYKNGNITIKIPAAELEQFKRDPVFELSEMIYWLDCYFIGETFCISNYDTAHMIYNCYSDLVYIFPWGELERLEQGKTVRLYARVPDSDDREMITEWEAGA